MSFLRFPSASLVPRYLDWWDLNYPHHYLDRHLGLGMPDNDLLSLLIRPQTLGNIAFGGSSQVTSSKDKFQVMLNVKQFKPDEIDIKTVDNYVVIRGKHEEKQDEHGFVSREFTRRYLLPEGVDPETVVSSLSADGMLTIQAPRKALEPPPKNERVVPITMQQSAAAAAVENAQATQSSTEGGK